VAVDARKDRGGNFKSDGFTKASAVVCIRHEYLPLGYVETSVKDNASLIWVYQGMNEVGFQQLYFNNISVTI
jgi:hypothetical protein